MTVLLIWPGMYYPSCSRTLYICDQTVVWYSFRCHVWGL